MGARGDTLIRDVRFAGRMLRKTPAFTAAAVFVVSLGSGGVTTVFSAINAILLRPVPGLGNVDRLVSIRPVDTDGKVADQSSYAEYAHLRDSTRTLEGIAAWGRASLTIAAGAEGSVVSGNLVTGSYFDLLGLQPALGRFFAPDEDRTPGGEPVLVVSHAFWQTRLGGDPEAIGRRVTVNGHPFTLIGVAPDGFHGVLTGIRVDAWVPITTQPQLRPRSNLATASWLWLFGRVRDGFARDVAQQELSALAAARAADLGAPSGGPRRASIRLDTFSGLPNGEGVMLMAFMALLLGAAGLVLLIAGVNVAAMLTARYAGRRRELAVRVALGAGRGRLLRQLLTEVLALFVLGGLGGFGVAILATAALERLPLPESVPVSIYLDLSPDARVLAFTLGVSLLAGVVFGVAPAFQAARADLSSRLRGESAAAGLPRALVSRALIAGQLALSLVLLVAAGLFTRALAHGARIDPGFDMAGVSTTLLEPESWGYDEARARRFVSALRERLEATPGISAVSFTARLPLTAGAFVDDIKWGDTALPVHYAGVAPGYFTALRLPLVSGRPFQASDDERAARVAVVNGTLARKLSPDGNAIGRTFLFRDTITTVVGIARDAKYATLDEVTPPFAYFPLAQVWNPTLALLVRADRAAEDPSGAIQAAVLSIDPLLQRPKVTTLRRAAAIVLLPQRAAAIVTGMLGAIGLLLSAAGLYGVMSFSASRRTREIGVRVALGARQSTIVRMMLRESLRLAAIGIVAGLLLAAAATRLLSAWLFNVSPLDRATFMATSAFFAAVVLAASYVPARRAAALDPVAALRAE